MISCGRDLSALLTVSMILEVLSLLSGRIGRHSIDSKPLDNWLPNMDSNIGQFQVVLSV